MSWLYDKLQKVPEEVYTIAAIAGVLTIATIGALSGKNEPTNYVAPIEERVAKEDKKKPEKTRDLPAPFVVNGTPASNLAIIVGDSADTTEVVGMGDVIQLVQREAVLDTRKAARAIALGSILAKPDPIDQAIVDYVKEQYARGNYKQIILGKDDDKMQTCELTKDGKHYMFFAADNKVVFITERLPEGARTLYIDLPKKSPN